MVFVPGNPEQVRAHGWQFTASSVETALREFRGRDGVALSVQDVVAGAALLDLSRRAHGPGRQLLCRLLCTGSIVLGWLWCRSARQAGHAGREDAPRVADPETRLRRISFQHAHVAALPRRSPVKSLRPGVSPVVLVANHPTLCDVTSIVSLFSACRHGRALEPGEQSTSPATRSRMAASSRSART